MMMMCTVILSSESWTLCILSYGSSGEGFFEASGRQCDNTSSNKVRKTGAGKMLKTCAGAGFFFIFFG